jgi:predicted nucleic acid-binding protein
MNYGMETRGLDKVLVDTSAWIDFFRKKEPSYSGVLKLLDEDRICCIGIVLAELIQGARTGEEIKILKDFTSVFPFIGESSRLWEKAGELAFSLRKSGQQVGLSECFIAIAANHEKAGILTLDDHFSVIQSHLDIVLL